MEVEQPLLTVEQMTAWYRVGRDAIATAEKLAAEADGIRGAISGVYTSMPIGIYLHPDTHKVAFYVPDESPARDVALLKSAMADVADVPDEGFVWSPTMKSGLVLEDEGWVKIAYSPALRTAGEWAGFFPHFDADKMQFTGMNPSPVRAMLTSGLVGAGLGYGAGSLIESRLPDSWRRGRLKNTLAAVGGLAGAVPGGAWMAANHAAGKPLNDNSLLYAPPGGPPDINWKAASDIDLLPEPGQWHKQAVAAYLQATWPTQHIKEAFDTLTMPWEAATRPGPTPMDVNINSLGQTLWDIGASPQLAGATMGALMAARQMPGCRSGEEGSSWVTPVQMANLAAHMGAGYVSGALVGNTLGLLTGMPESAQDVLKQTGVYLGIVKAVLPRLFG